MKRPIKPNPKLSARDRGTVYELRQRMEEGGFWYSRWDVERVERRILRLRSLGESSSVTSDDGERNFTVSLEDGRVVIVARYLGPDHPTKRRQSLEIMAARAMKRGKVPYGTQAPTGRLPLPLPNWEPLRELRVVEQDWEVVDIISRPETLQELVSEEFKPDIEWISKIALRGFWAIQERMRNKKSKLLLGGAEVPAKASNPDFRAALIPHLQKPRVTMQVVWGPEPDNVETIHLSVAGDRLVVAWDGPASGVKA